MSNNETMTNFQLAVKALGPKIESLYCHPENGEMSIAIFPKECVTTGEPDVREQSVQNLVNVINELSELGWITGHLSSFGWVPFTDGGGAVMVVPHVLAKHAKQAEAICSKMLLTKQVWDK